MTTTLETDWLRTPQEKTDTNMSGIVFYPVLLDFDHKIIDHRDICSWLIIWHILRNVRREYVAKCTRETQPCDPMQVNAFYLRKCPRGTQLINSTVGTFNFDLVSQQCVPCGPLNYIDDPGSGGTCQECPKVTVHSVCPLLNALLNAIAFDDVLTPILTLPTADRELFVQMATCLFLFRTGVNGRLFFREPAGWMP